MKAIKHIGTCKLCGKVGDMSPEHVPPKNAFNKTDVMILPFDEVLKTVCNVDGRLPWDTKGLKGERQQGGHKKYCLCQSCNNNTGQWYMRAYTDLAKTIHTIIVEKNLEVGSAYSFTIKNVYPLRIYKAMMTMICDINSNCLGDENLRKFLMNKEDTDFDNSQYSLYMYMVSPQMPRLNGLSAIGNLYNPNESVLVSEMSSYPIGFALYLNKPDSYNPFGLNIDEFSKYSYNDKFDIQFVGIPYCDINIQFPADYRSKDDIIQCILQTEKQMSENK